MAAKTPSRATSATQRRYDRLAPLYDLMEGMLERVAFARWRKRLWGRVSGGSVLEIGVGTGKNMPYYPPGADVTAIDLSPRMLARAAARAQKLGVPVRLARMDVQTLAFPDESFDYVVASFVFCSVPDPVAGLRQAARVCKSEGTVLLLEHVRLDRPVVGRLMDALNPLLVRVIGASINRRTVENVRLAGLTIVSVEEMTRGGLVKLITARPACE